MEIKTICYAPEFSENIDGSRIFYFDENETLEKIRTSTGLIHYHLSLVNYYPIAAMSLRERVPYIVKDHNIVWKLPYSDVTLRELIDTNHIDINRGVELRFMGVGGLGDDLLSGVYELWIEYSPIFHDYLNCVEDTAFVVSLMKGFIAGFNKKEQSTPEFWDLVDFFEKKNEWKNINIICETLGLKESIVSEILISIGYVKSGSVYKLNKRLNKRFHETATRKINSFWGDMYVSAINVNILFLKYLHQEYGVAYREKEIEKKLNDIVNNDPSLKKGVGIRCLEYRKISRFLKKSKDENCQDKLLELYNLTDKEVRIARKKARI